jgi:hypothetical protein
MALYEKLTKQYERLARDAERIASQQHRLQARLARQAANAGQDGSDEALDQMALPFEPSRPDGAGSQWWSDPGASGPYDEPSSGQLSLFEDEPFAPAVESGLVMGSTATEWYVPTKTINPGRPRTLQMSYNRETHVLRVFYRDGGTYDYADVPSSVWYRIRRVQSPGRFINRNILDQYDYTKVAL